METKLGESLCSKKCSIEWVVKDTKTRWSGDDGDDMEEEEVEAKSAKAFLRLFTLLPKETKKKPEKNSQETVFDLFYTSTACGGF